MLIEIKAVFARSLEKIQTTQDTAYQHLPVKKQAEPKEAIVAPKLAKTASIKPTKDIAQQVLSVNKQTKLREVKIPTTSVGTGSTYAHPAKPDFNNQIIAVLEFYKGGCNTFETADGKVGEGLGNGVDPVRIPINPVKSEISKI